MVDNPAAQIEQILAQMPQQTEDPNTQLINNITSNFSFDPANVNAAQSKLGNQDDDGLCQKFVEEATYGKSGIFPSAIDAWDTYTQNGQAQPGDITKAPSGSLIYFAPDNSNQGFGHVGISDGKGSMISATDNGVTASNVNDWMSQTGQTALGFVKP